MHSSLPILIACRVYSNTPFKKIVQSIVDWRGVLGVGAYSQVGPSVCTSSQYWKRIKGVISLAGMRPENGGDPLPGFSFRITRGYSAFQITLDLGCGKPPSEFICQGYVNIRFWAYLWSGRRGEVVYGEGKGLLMASRRKNWSAKWAQLVLFTK